MHAVYLIAQELVILNKGPNQQGNCFCAHRQASQFDLIQHNCNLHLATGKGTVKKAHLDFLFFFWMDEQMCSENYTVSVLFFFISPLC